VVECDLAKVEVAGSNPVSRSSDSKNPRLRARVCREGRLLLPVCPVLQDSLEGRGSQVVRQRSAKPLFASSILARASKFSL
jgi:hypothetical protein